MNKEIELEVMKQVNLLFPCSKEPIAITSAIELAIQQTLFVVKKIIDEIENPYPEDIFPKLELSEFQTQTINDFLVSNLRFPIDRLSAELMRRARNTLKEELKQKLIGSEEKK